MTDERSIRDYLTWLTDPHALPCTVEMRRLRTKYAMTTDPVERERLSAALDRARNVVEDASRAHFVAAAQRWAKREGVDVSAFRALGVPDDVLREAGLTDVPSRSSDESGAKVRRSRVTVSTVCAWVDASPGPFTAQFIADSIGGSRSTIRKALSGLIAEGRLIVLVPQHRPHQRGRRHAYYVKPVVR